MRPGRSSLWGFLGAGTSGLKNNKGVADQFGEQGIPSFWDGFQTEGGVMEKFVGREWYHLLVCVQNEIHPEKVTWQ